MIINEEIRNRATAALKTAGEFSLYLVREMSGLNGISKAILAWNELRPFETPSKIPGTLKSVATFSAGLLVFGRIQEFTTQTALQSGVRLVSRIALLVSDIFLCADWLEDWAILPQGAMTASKVAVLRSPSDWIGWGADIADVMDIRKIWNDGLSMRNFDRLVTVGSAVTKLVGVIQRSKITSYSPQLRVGGAVFSSLFFLAKQCRKYATSPAA
jgi:hypothetical protein